MDLNLIDPRIFHPLQEEEPKHEECEWDQKTWTLVPFGEERDRAKEERPKHR